MIAKSPSAERTMRMADRLSAARRGRFVGRLRELELFRAALLSNTATFAVLYIYGPGGVGKTALLREYTQIAVESGRSVIHLDGRNVDPSPVGFLLALGQSFGIGEFDIAHVIDAWPSNGILLLDTYELLASLDTWLREQFLPELPASNLVVIAGRNSPELVWRADIEWAELTRVVALGNLYPEESQTYLAARGIPTEQHESVLTFTHGHPLALALMADIWHRDGTLESFDPQREPNVVHALLGRLMDGVPSVEHRLALEVCARVWATTEGLLAAVLGDAQAHDLFQWLCQLSFIEQGPHGVFPHDLARDALDADLRWRNPDGYRQLTERVLSYLLERFQQARGLEQQRIWFDYLFLARHNPVYQACFEWNVLEGAYAEPVSGQDHAAILAMIQRHEGDASAQIGMAWLQRQPDAFLAFRNIEGKLCGFMAQIALHTATPDEIAADPAAAAAVRYAEDHGPVRPGEEIVYCRFMMGRDTYQAASSAVTLTAINCSIYWTTHPKLAWYFMAPADSDRFQPLFSSIHFERVADADCEVGGRHYGAFAHDWRVEPAAAWLKVKAALVSSVHHEPDVAQRLAAPALRVLSQTEYAAAVRQALRDYTRPDQLVANPLMSSRLVTSGVSQDASPASLQTLLLEAIDSLTTNAKDLKLYRALWHTYVETTSSQEQTAELLQIPFSTYRYQLAKATERVVDWLWQRELNRTGH